MKKNICILSLLLLNGSCQSQPSLSQATAAKTVGSEIDPLVMHNRKQLTYVGKRSGEGYFSADGKMMVFQSERDEGNPFYQIYLMDLETGKTQRISPGKGKTTCAWIHPSKKKILFASTHLDPKLQQKVKEEEEARKNPQKGKYGWSYDDQYDIFEYSLVTKKYKRLTKELGYDAEGAYSPDGQWIVFASNRAGYTEKLSAEDAKLFAQDPSYMMDIYKMKADGTHVQRLTTAKGYDGGPFFSADGTKITWRRFATNGQTAEIMVMNADGSDQRQITHLGVMSWAPFFHPSGDYIIFTANVLGHSNFELYIVDTAGLKTPVRVSYIDGFDGLPVFTPDGNKLSWTHRSDRGDSQIYMADWDDSKARALLGLAPRPFFPKLAETIDIPDAKAWVEYLASEKMAGRRTGSPEEEIYTQKIAETFKALGLQPENGHGYVQPFEFIAGVSLGSKEAMTVKMKNKEETLKVGEDYTPLSFSMTGKFPSAPVAFVGYGIVAPASEKQPAFDSYKDLNVNGKWVLAFRDIPEKISNERRIYLNMYSRVQHKAMVAKQRGAVGLILINVPQSGAVQQLMKLKYEGSFAETGIPVLSLRTDWAEKMVQNSGGSLKAWQDEVDAGGFKNAELPQISISAQVDLQTQKSHGRNVLATLKVPGATGTLMIGAHGDHLGHGDVGSSLARNEEQGLIHYGADDNASGVAGVMELAQRWSRLAKEGRLHLTKNVTFAIWSGEEIGLVGSSSYLKTTKQKISTYLNMDMIGRLRDALLVQGVGSAREWKSWMEQESLRTAVPITLTEDPYLPTDSMAFYMKDIPTISFFTGSHAEYHSPRDRADTLNYEGLVKVLDIVDHLAQRIAGKESLRLTFQKVESSKSQLQGRGFRVYLGTIPDYSQEGVKGVKISGTSRSSPAEKAGLLPGDVIVELAGSKIENLYDYVYLLQAIKANESTPIKIQRKGRVEELKITPVLKE